MKRMALPAATVVIFTLFTSFSFKQKLAAGYEVVIDKSDYSLSVFDDRGWLVTYPVVFGNSDLRDKLYEGDRKTPIGSFTIVTKRLHPKWDKMMLLDYPNQQSIERFNQRKQQGIIPQSAKIGGGIGIHGTWPHDEMTVNRFGNWTDGCISLRNVDVDELYNMIPIGTTVIIRM